MRKIRVKALRKQAIERLKRSPTKSEFRRIKKDYARSPKRK